MGRYTDKEEEVILERATEYMSKNPKTSRGKLAIYAGVSIMVLERLENEGRIELPKKLTVKQARATSPWAKGRIV